MLEHIKSYCFNKSSVKRSINHLVKNNIIIFLILIIFCSCESGTNQSIQNESEQHNQPQDTDYCWIVSQMINEYEAKNGNAILYEYLLKLVTKQAS